MDQIWRQRPEITHRKRERPIMATSYECDATHRETWHLHDEGRFVFTMSGVLRVTTPIGMWTLGPQRGLWIAPRVGHEWIATSAVCMHSVSFEPEASPWPESACHTVRVSPLLRELVAALVEDRERDPESRHALITPLLLSEMRASREASGGGLPLPLDRRLRQICDFLLAAPANGDSLAIWGERVGASERTLARRFKDETGLTFGHWRQQLRIVEAVSKLAQGVRVAEIAAELGYANSSAFISMFRKTMGEPPQRYLKREPR
ncbi:helix-turn-helix transcriptional regulator [Paraburkholderia sp. CNPSo 3076]|uniref:AraC family transcriptional regulator n=1 Tax=Paraburkholderia sp. CNPSo 3076 TaxID=2940936 RepID=UPI00224EED67|nr:helix-turn-helix transcriptional regulator [Paraburkholderia sp. CNPSo 3076]MCX5540916.1 helix-turn-helix transcriptional regulator [Paraburkholderia sp. CNPSo 3076]